MKALLETGEVHPNQSMRRKKTRITTIRDVYPCSKSGTRGIYIPAYGFSGDIKAVSVSVKELRADGFIDRIIYPIIEFSDFFRNSGAPIPENLIGRQVIAVYNDKNRLTGLIPVLGDRVTIQ